MLQFLRERTKQNVKKATKIIRYKILKIVPNEEFAIWTGLRFANTVLTSQTLPKLIGKLYNRVLLESAARNSFINVAVGGSRNTPRRSKKVDCEENKTEKHRVTYTKSGLVRKLPPFLATCTQYKSIWSTVSENRVWPFVSEESYSVLAFQHIPRWARVLVIASVFVGILGFEIEVHIQKCC